MKIVLLDHDHITTDSSLWEPLKHLGRFTAYAKTSPDQMLERCKDAEIILINRTPVRKNLMEKLPKLRYIGVIATGYDAVDVESARERYIIVKNVTSYCNQETAQHAMALLLEITNQIGLKNQRIHAGKWEEMKNECLLNKSMISLDGLIFGIIGYGSTGKAVGRLAQAFGMKVIFCSRSAQKIDDLSIQQTDQKTLLETSDVISLHCPLTPAVHHLINEKTLGLMKSSAILLNVARGGLINEKHLAKALKERKIYAAGVDVLEEQPPAGGNPLLSLDNFFVTPHIAWLSEASRERLASRAIENVRNFLSGQPDIRNIA